MGEHTPETFGSGRKMTYENLDLAPYPLFSRPMTVRQRAQRASSIQCSRLAGSSASSRVEAEDGGEENRELCCEFAWVVGGRFGQRDGTVMPLIQRQRTEGFEVPERAAES